MPLTAAGSRKIPPPTVVLKIAAERPKTPMARTRPRSDSMRNIAVKYLAWSRLSVTRPGNGGYGHASSVIGIGPDVAVP